MNLVKKDLTMTQIENIATLSLSLLALQVPDQNVTLKVGTLSDCLESISKRIKQAKKSLKQKWGEEKEAGSGDFIVPDKNRAEYEAEYDEWMNNVVSVKVPEFTEEEFKRVKQKDGDEKVDFPFPVAIYKFFKPLFKDYKGDVNADVDLPEIDMSNVGGKPKAKSKRGQSTTAETE